MMGTVMATETETAMATTTIKQQLTNCGSKRNGGDSDGDGDGDSDGDGDGNGDGDGDGGGNDAPPPVDF